MDEDQGRGEQSIICPECGWHGRLLPGGAFEVGDEGDPTKNAGANQREQLAEIDRIIEGATPSKEAT